MTPHDCATNRTQQAGAMTSMEAMQQFKALYVERCRDFLCKPVAPLMDTVNAAMQQGVVLNTIKLNGNSKELFNKRVEYMQVRFEFHINALSS